jgi:hypothetical protein
MTKKLFDLSRLEIWITILIAIVSLTTALVAWRTNAVASSAEDQVRQGLVDAVKKQAMANENWRKTYEEAAFARDFSVYQAGVVALENSGMEIGQAQATNLRQYLLPNLQLLSAPLGTEDRYLESDGTYNLQLRFTDLESESGDVSALDPVATFKRSDNYFSEQRWLTIGAILLTVSLFWLALAEIGGSRFRKWLLVVGAGIYVFSLAWFVVVEAVFIIGRGGVL